jgi:hypothetical protein
LGATLTTSSRRRPRTAYAPSLSGFFAPTGESLWFVEGDYEALLGIFATPEAEKFLFKGPILLQGFGYNLYRTEREEIFGRYEETLTELGVS